MTWQSGAETVAQLLAEGKLELISGTAADGGALLASAKKLLASAEREASENPEAAYVLAYDAARKSCAALLAQQGLRTKGSGHHVTTERVVRAQFAGPFALFGGLRRRRVEIEYPRFPGDDTPESDAIEAIRDARLIYSRAVELRDLLSTFHEK